MQYYLIYSAGGGGGEWNGLKRIWEQYMQEELKSHILIKFGDIFFNHENVGRTLYKPKLWNGLTNARSWLYENTGDDYVLNKSNIVLDSGTAKAVSWIASHYKGLEPLQYIDRFDKIADECGLVEKYVDFVTESKIDLAVTFDLPNPFKTRADSNLSRRIMDTDDNEPFIKHMAQYANLLFHRLGEEPEHMLTIINGKWSVEEYQFFLSLLDYIPCNIAVGALSDVRGRCFREYLGEVNHFDLQQYKRVHFLGCGGIEKVKILKENGYSDEKYSVDCATPVNRAFCDGISNYCVYGTGKLIKIRNDTKKQILLEHEKIKNPYYSIEELSDIIDLVIEHQKGREYHTPETFDARAKVMLHNSDVFKRNAM